jgi:hypothetical protein
VDVIEASLESNLELKIRESTTIANDKDDNNTILTRIVDRDFLLTFALGRVKFRYLAGTFPV